MNMSKNKQFFSLNNDHLEDISTSYMGQGYDKFVVGNICNCCH